MTIQQKTNSILWDCTDQAFLQRELKKAFMFGLLPHLQQVCHAANPMPNSFEDLVQFAVTKEAQMMVPDTDEIILEHRAAPTSRICTVQSAGDAQNETHCRRLLRIQLQTWQSKSRNKTILR
jgi:hypothetical protein